jgi:dolichol-phosphate mannosyltransferase
MSKKLISIFTPVFNEEDNIPHVYETVKRVMTALNDRYEYEHVFSDNASTDRSVELLRELSQQDSRVKLIALSRNFGVTKSTLNGLYRCQGDAVVQLDADLQDPPEMIIDFIEKWEQGYKVVYGIRKDRDEGWVMKNIRRLFYRMAESLSNETLIPDVGEFRLMDKRIIQELRKIKDYNPYLRGVIANLGFPQAGIPYHRNRRERGKTSTNLYRLFDYGMNGIISHSTILLRLSTMTGIFLALIAFALIILYALLKIILQSSPAGLTTITILILFFSGIQMIFLGIIGEYIAKIYSQTIDRPMVIERELIGFKEQDL